MMGVGSWELAETSNYVVIIWYLANEALNHLLEHEGA